MDLSVFVRMDVILQIHVVSALLAVVLMPVVLWRKRRDGLHRTFGYAWVSAMAITAISALGISGIRMVGPFSPLHLLAVFTLASLVSAIWQIRRGNVSAHQSTMRSLATLGLGLPLVMTFLPGRRMSQMVFPERPIEGLVLMGGAFTLILLWRWRLTRRVVAA